MVQASLMLMYPLASASLTSGQEPPRVGNRGFSGSPAADTYRCNDGWLATAANTPAQFRALARVLELESLCADARALDLEKFNAPSGGFVVAKDFDYLVRKLHAAFAERSAVEMEHALNGAGVPAARVRGLGEFLSEAPGKVTLPQFSFGDGVKTPGLGFLYAEDADRVSGDAPELGSHRGKPFS
jgi:crotonobetainyl-CoA:carnitine CoA-transferase CaiB-like acyl-CoA transferase